MDVINALAADQQRIQEMLNEISDAPSAARRDKLSKLRSFLMHHREVEEVCLYRLLEDASSVGHRRIAEASVKDTEEIDYLETLYDFGMCMDSVLWIEMFADLQSLMESNMEWKRQEMYDFARSHKFLMDKAS